jgi:hypothetical protein
MRAVTSKAWRIVLGSLGHRENNFMNRLERDWNV